ncbi:MAG: outer membrane lipid asymmetry maintenance protein MlaD [Candidatus Sumerlaeota bacterium]
MENKKTEFLVGIFLLIGIVCVGYLTVRLGKMEIIGGGYYPVVARFTSVSGLREGAIVDIAGVEVGQVATIELDQEYYLAKVTILVRKDLKLDADTIASVKTRGLIGDKYIKLQPGGAEEILQSGDEIIETESAVDLEEMVSKYAFGDV